MRALHDQLNRFADDGDELELEAVAFAPHALRAWATIVKGLVDSLEAIMVEYPDMCADVDMCNDPSTMEKINAAREAIRKAKGD